MPKFGAKSLERLRTCHDDLQLLCHAILDEMDITVLCGHRGEQDQNKAFAEGKSQLKFPKSKHNSMPSLAVDIAPHPLDWSDIERFEKMCEIAERLADKMGIDIRLGRDFSFRDYPHLELVTKNDKKGR